jgi:hypothetical protein
MQTETRGEERGQGRGTGGAEGADDIAKFEDASESAELGEVWRCVSNSCKVRQQEKEKKRKSFRYGMWKVSFLYFPFLEGRGFGLFMGIWVFCNLFFFS